MVGSKACVAWTFRQRHPRSVRKILGCQVTVEVHRAVEDPNDLKRLPLNGEEDDVLLVAGGAAAFCQIFP